MDDVRWLRQALYPLPLWLVVVLLVTFAFAAGSWWAAPPAKRITEPCQCLPLTSR